LPVYLLSYIFFVFRSICSHLVFFCVISEHLFSYRFVCVFGCRSSCSHIVFSGFFRSICSHIVLSVFFVAGAAVLI
jgi:hypothetical protein